MTAPNANTARANGPVKTSAKPTREKLPRTPKRSFPASNFAGVEAVLQSGGQPLEPGLRARMEHGFGYDFGRLRIHTDQSAGESARLMGARAYAVGRHVVFDHGEYRPNNAAGKHLIAHELAHVVQQGASDYRTDRLLEVQPGDSASEREADRAAANVSRSERANVRTATATGVQRLQRAEHGTYISTLSETGSREYLDAGANYYRTWGHPNVKRVANTKQILDDLDTAKGTIDKFRIVSHGNSTGIELGLLPDISSDFFTIPSVSKYTGQAGFREDFSSLTIVAEKKAIEIYGALWKDKTTNPLLALLGGGKGIPGMATDFGILFRALVDERYLTDAKLDDDTPAKIAHAGEARKYVNLRRDTYGRVIVDAKPKNEQADARKAIAELRKQIPAVMAAAKITFSSLTQDEAKTLADPLIDDKGSLNKSLSKSIEEGADGPFLKKLKSVRAKITEKTQIEIRGCNVGSKNATMDGIRAFFGNPGALPSLSAPDLFQYFYQLNVKSYSAREQADLEAVYDDAPVGVKAGFDDLRRTKAGEMVRVAINGTLKELSARYGFNADDAFKFNPEIGKKDDIIPEGTVLWLVQRDVAPIGRHKGLMQFCEMYLGKPYAWPKVWAANPQIANPKNVGPSDAMAIPKDLLNAKFASMADLKSTFVSAVRGGEAVAGLASELDVNVRTRTGVTKRRQTFEHPRPVLHIDDAKRNQALGAWLSRQNFDPAGRTAKTLGDRFGRSGAQFETARANTYVQFLSRGYPKPEDPIFPEDPRYAKHIRQRP